VPFTVLVSAMRKYPLETAEDIFHLTIVVEPATRAPLLGEVTVGVAVERFELVRRTTTRSVRLTSVQGPILGTVTERALCPTAKRCACPLTTS